MKQLFLLTAVLILFSVPAAFAQQKASIGAKETSHDFGVIKEENGEVEHVFVIENTGDSPLVINRITTSCGCAQPEWSKDPVPPGKTKEIKIWYDPTGRPGTFYKTISVYSNTEPRRFVMTIKGEVLRKQKSLPEVIYPYSIGDLKLLSKVVSFNTLRPEETNGERIPVKNSGESTLSIRFDALPPAITAEARPQTLQPDETGEIIFLLDAAAIGKKGHYTTTIPVTVQTTGSGPATQTLRLTANIIDDFSKLPASEKANAPSIRISSTLLDFGKVENKSSILGIGGKVSRTMDITNKGKSVLTIYSISPDDDLIEISGGKKEIKPNSTVTFRVTLRPNAIKAQLESTITIVCNDPGGPVRLIKVIAVK